MRQFGIIIVVIMVNVIRMKDSCCECCLDSERNALLRVNSSFHLWGWDGDIDCCDWFGVECNTTTGHVTQLDLDGYTSYSNSGEWYLNASLFLRFQQLNQLDLSYNNISGFIHHDGLERLWALTNLENLDLSFNNFNSSILQSLSGFPSLKSLKLGWNKLNGAINLTGLCNLKHLEFLDMSYNDLNGILPWCLSNLTYLQQLDLSYNQFTGSISSTHGLTSLQYLNISNNHFLIPMSLSPLFNLSLLTNLDVGKNKVYADTEDRSSNPKFQLEGLYMDGFGSEGGAIPKFLYRQSKLEDLVISNIKLTGGFQYWWLLENNTSLLDLNLANTSLSGTLQLPTHPHVNLTYLDVSDNFFHGYIPSQIGVYFPSLSELDISHNNISGTIPQCIGNMSNLGVLDLSSNRVSGTLPSSFSALPFYVVNLSKNRLYGSLKDALYSCIDIFRLDLSYNSFSGSIPPEFGKLPQLSFLVLANNNLQGEIPVELCKLQLSLLDLSHNKISGHMLPCLNITSSLSWSANQLSIAGQATPLEITIKGYKYLYERERLTYISEIDISCNNLTGKIPFELGDLRSIKALNLSYNCLTGPIPSTFSSLKEIESLDLSHNNLQGTIPHQLTQLTSLEVFDVSYNNLSGQTPGQVAKFLTFSESSYKGNPFLCGWPLSNSCGTPDSSPQSNATSSLHGDKSNNEFIDMEFFYVSFGVAYAMVLLTLVTILCINPYWRRIWFYYVQMSTEKTYYFIIDNVIPHFSRF